MKTRFRVTTFLPGELNARTRRYAAKMGVSYSSVVEAALQAYFVSGAQPPPPARLRKGGSRKRVTQSSIVEAAPGRYVETMERSPPSPEELEAAWQGVGRVLGWWESFMRALLGTSDDVDPGPPLDERDPSKRPN